jgi:sugar O-acyltransferase (sialic acid O-acetyltransferase NeuD family)
VEHRGSRVIAVFDDTPNLTPPFSDVPLFRGWSGFETWAKGRPLSGIGFSVTIGNPHGRIRLALHTKLKAAGLVPTIVVHPFAWVESNAALSDGVTIMGGAFVGAEARLGKEVIVNTKASVDHECVLGDGSQAAPGATLCGLVTTGTNAWICAGATVNSRMHIGDDAIVGAGAVVIRDVPPGACVMGVPATPQQRPKWAPL